MPITAWSIFLKTPVSELLFVLCFAESIQSARLRAIHVVKLLTLL
jgi:hypothetical protein